MWNIRISSLNKGVMVGSNPKNTDVYPYLLQFGDTNSINLKNDYSTSVTIMTQKAILEYDVVIWYTKYEDLENLIASDTYTDTITVTLAAL